MSHVILAAYHHSMPHASKFTNLYISRQIAIGTDDVYKTAEAIKLCGGKITREPGPLPGISTKITACLDPDGWKTVILSTLRDFPFTLVEFACL